MPRFDRTGPEGQGSQTGRKLGKCNTRTQKSNTQDTSNESSVDNEIRRGRGLKNALRLGRGKGQRHGLNKGNS